MTTSRIIFIFILLMSFHAHAENKEIIGAGNASCEYWTNADKPIRNEIISWMMGFTSAMNFDDIYSGNQRYQLELITYDYLTHEINKYCAENNEQIMFSVLLKALNNLPSHFE